MFITISTCRVSVFLAFWVSNGFWVALQPSPFQFFKGASLRPTARSIYLGCSIGGIAFSATFSTIYGWNGFISLQNINDDPFNCDSREKYLRKSVTLCFDVATALLSCRRNINSCSLVCANSLSFVV